MASPRTRFSPEQVASSRQSARDRMRAGLHPDVVAAAEGSGEVDPAASAANSGQDEAPQGAGDLTGQYPASPAPEPGHEDAYKRLAALMQMAAPPAPEAPQIPAGTQSNTPMLGAVQQMMRGR